MSSTKIFVALVGVAIVAGGGYVFFMKGNVGSSEMHDDKPAIVDAPAGKKMAFSEFIKQGGSHVCTVNQSVHGIETNGTAYISDGMIRGEFDTQVQGMKIRSTLIVRDGYTYTWTSMAPTMGYKMKVVEAKPQDTNAPASGSYSFNAEQIGDYDCQSWVRDEAKFVIPTNVKFTEMKK